MSLAQCDGGKRLSLGQKFLLTRGIASKEVLEDTTVRSVCHVPDL